MGVTRRQPSLRYSALADFVMRVVALLSLASLASCWVTISQSRFGAQLSVIQGLYGANGSQSANTPIEVSTVREQQQLGYLWTTPEDSTSHRGLGGGITWAWDPALCPHILRQFREDFFFVPFVTCEMLRSAMHRAFASWSDNNARIAFHDVTAECDKLSATGKAEITCPLVELWVTYIGAAEQASGEADAEASLTTSALTVDDARHATVVEPYEDWKPELSLGAETVSAATAMPHAQYTSTFRYTNGARPARTRVIEVTSVWLDLASSHLPLPLLSASSMLIMGVCVRRAQTVGATLSFNTELCWYLDSTFCSSFHSLKGRFSSMSASEVLWILRGVLLAIWSVALILLICQLVHALRASVDHKRGVRTKCYAVMDSLNRKSMLATTFFFVLLVAPPAFYAQILIPCWDCYDFEAAATHEVAVHAREHAPLHLHMDTDMDTGMRMHVRVLGRGHSPAYAHPGHDAICTLPSEAAWEWRMAGTQRLACETSVWAALTFGAGGARAWALTPRQRRAVAVYWHWLWDHSRLQCLPCWPRRRRPAHSRQLHRPLARRCRGSTTRTWLAGRRGARVDHEGAHAA